mmetsp:Transcript_12165/g.21993  ORF Transcript_12165/g.21993 Transcript_12165/m.21993 type:complete len:134 (-) Transcript_12165:1819-2220(-)
MKDVCSSSERSIQSIGIEDEGRNFIHRRTNCQELSPEIDQLVRLLPGTMLLGEFWKQNSTNCTKAEYNTLNCMQNIAFDLIDSCFKMYLMIRIHLAPEIVWIDLESEEVLSDMIRLEADAQNILRPETLESHV